MRSFRSQQQVELHERGVDASQPAEKPVMGDPHATDCQEARHVRQIGRPLMLQIVAEMTQIRGNLYLQHQDRDRDREHAVAERVHPTLIPPG